MRTLIALLLSTLACSAQLTLQRAHYPTLFKSGASSTPPVTGFQLWITPDSTAWSDFSGTTVATQNQNIIKLEDLSGLGNHLYWPSNLHGVNSEGCHFANDYTLSSRRILQFGRNCPAGVANNKTGLRTSNSIPLVGGFTVFYVGSFLSPCTSAESFGTWFGYNGVELLFRWNNAAYQLTTYHNSGATVITDPVTIGLSNYQAYAWTFSDAGNSTSMYRSNNSVATATDNGAVPASGLVSIGFRADDGINGHVNGGLLEFILYTNALTTLQISNVNVYLLNKYGL